MKFKEVSFKGEKKYFDDAGVELFPTDTDDVHTFEFIDANGLLRKFRSPSKVEIIYDPDFVPDPLLASPDDIDFDDEEPDFNEDFDDIVVTNEEIQSLIWETQQKIEVEEKENRKNNIILILFILFVIWLVYQTFFK